MNHHLLRVLAFSAAVFWTGHALAVTVSIDTSAATAVLKAIQDPNLSLAQATRIAGMPGNRGAIRKLRSLL